ncbi:hypothetical protein Tco_0059284 [Tanacetum coccineum]
MDATTICTDSESISSSKEILCIQTDIVISDSEDSTVTYTVVSSPFEGLSDIGSLGVNGPPMMLEDQYAYVVAAFQAPPSLDYVLHHRFSDIVMSDSEDSTVTYTVVSSPFEGLSDSSVMPPEDEVFPTKEQPLHAVRPPSASSPRYIANSDPAEDEEDHEEDPIDYPVDGGDDDDDDDESSDDDKDDDDDDVEEDEDKEEEEENPAPADSEEVERFLSIPTPPPSLLTPLSSPLLQIPSPPLPVSLPLLVSYPPLPVSPTYLLGFRAPMIRLRAESPSTSHLPPPIILSHTSESMAIMRAAAPSTYSLAPPSGTPPFLHIPLPTSSPPLLLPSIDHRAEIPEVSEQTIVLLLPWMQRLGVIQREMFVIDFVTTVRHDTDEIYGILDDAQDERSLMSGGLNMLFRDRRAHAYTALLMEREARLSREAWGWSIDASDTARSEVRALRTTVLAHQMEIAALRVADRARQAQLMGTLRLMKKAPIKQPDQTPAATATTTTTMTNAQLKEMIDQGVTDALAAHDADRNTNGDDSHNSGTCVRRTKRVSRECTYPDFMMCQPLNFKGTEEVVELIKWFEKMETVFSISNYSVENQIKFSTCTLLAGELMWWNSHVKTIAHDFAYAMTWTNLKNKMTELWNLKVKGTDVIGYNQRFQELALMCVRMFPKESNKIERYVGGLPNMIHGSVVASNPKTMQEAIEIATELMDKKICTFDER